MVLNPKIFGFLVWSLVLKAKKKWFLVLVFGSETKNQTICLILFGCKCLIRANCQFDGLKAKNVKNVKFSSVLAKKTTINGPIKAVTAQTLVVIFMKIAKNKRDLICLVVKALIVPQIFNASSEKII